MWALMSQMTRACSRVVWRLVDLSADLRAQLVLSSGEMTDRVQEIHDEIDTLVKELVQLEMRQAEKEKKGPKMNTRREAEVPRPVFEVSDVVEVTAQDRYYKRRGMIVGKRGVEFWNVVLEKKAGEAKAPLTHKKAGSLRRVPTRTHANA